MSRFFLTSAVLLAACNSDQGINGIPDDPQIGFDTADTSVPTDTIDTQDTQDTDIPVEESRPVAVCSVEPGEVTPPFEDATFKGGQSYDPMGHAIVDFNWSFAAVPSGSSVTMPTGNNANRTVRPDLAGDYVGRLVVTTDDGRVSEPCDTIVTAVPGTDLWVELYWTHGGDDMDLHLLKPGGTPRGGGDCYYANTNPNWGDTASRADDPRLDLDDIPGTGPENINISEPADSGAYEVWVDDYSGSTGDSPSTTAVTVNIYIGGALVYTDTKSCARECADMHFADINWPAGTVTAR